MRLFQMLRNNGTVREFYNLLYCADSRGLQNTAALDVCESGVKGFNEDDFLDQMENLSMCGCRDIQPPFRNHSGEAIFHVSKGNGETSASIFFCIYAVPNREFAQEGAGETTVLKVTAFHKPPNTQPKLKIGDREQPYLVNEENLSITADGKKYYLVYRLVGIGCHTGNGSKEYKLIVRDETVLSEPNIKL